MHGKPLRHGARFLLVMVIGCLSCSHIAPPGGPQGAPNPITLTMKLYEWGMAQAIEAAPQTHGKASDGSPNGSPGNAAVYFSGKPDFFVTPFTDRIAYCNPQSEFLVTDDLSYCWLAHSSGKYRVVTVDLNAGNAVQGNLIPCVAGHAYAFRLAAREVVSGLRSLGSSCQRLRAELRLNDTAIAHWPLSIEDPADLTGRIRRVECIPGQLLFSQVMMGQYSHADCCTVIIFLIDGATNRGVIADGFLDVTLSRIKRGDDGQRQATPLDSAGRIPVRLMATPPNVMTDPQRGQGIVFRQVWEGDMSGSELEIRVEYETPNGRRLSGGTISGIVPSP